jgi:hypothetical protein
VEALGVHSPEHPTLTPVPSPEFISASLEREAIRRIFWYIHLIDVKASIYFKKPITFTAAELRLRLPVDETSFELGVHSTLPGMFRTSLVSFFLSHLGAHTVAASICIECTLSRIPCLRCHILTPFRYTEYLHLPAVRTQYASEFGHLIRIITIYAKVELIMDEVNGKWKRHVCIPLIKVPQDLTKDRRAFRTQVRHYWKPNNNWRFVSGFTREGGGVKNTAKIFGRTGHELFLISFAFLRKAWMYSSQCLRPARTLVHGAGAAFTSTMRHVLLP